MKSKTKKVFITLLMGLTTLTTYSQSDSVKVEYSQEKITKAHKMDEAICDVLTRRENQGKNLWKFNLLRTFLDGFTVSYERKIAPKWSLDISSVTTMSGIYIYRDYFDYSRFLDRRSNLKETLSLELRYYYNLDRRIRLAKKAGFSGNYLGLGMSSMYNYLYERIYDTPPKVPYGVIAGFTEYINFQFSSSLNLIYGIQRKIGRIGYIDASVGIGMAYLTASNHFWNDKNYTFEIDPSLKLGVGIAF